MHLIVRNVDVNLEIQNHINIVLVKEGLKRGESNFLSRLNYLKNLSEKNVHIVVRKNCLMESIEKIVASDIQKKIVFHVVDVVICQNIHQVLKNF